MSTTSREAYEAAVARNKTAVENVRQAKAALERAQDELIAADAALCAQEARPGVPLWTRQQPRLRPADNRGYDPPGCARCDATYTLLDDNGHCVNISACGRRRQAAARDTAKAGATS